MFVSLGSTSLIVGPPYTSLISPCLCFAGSRYRHTVPLGFGTVTKLLHHSAIPSTHSGANIKYSCSLSNSFFE